jgi:hypothetical protein
MAGTMPHAIFIETGVDGGATVAAYAAELPGCATFAGDPDEAAAAMPLRVIRFTDWLRAQGEESPSFVGDNWYEVERGSAGAGAGERAAFTLDELPPSEEEWIRWLRWMELAREDLASALDAASPEAAASVAGAIAAQDEAFIESLGGDPPAGAAMDPLARWYAARDTLTDALERVGPGGEGVRRVLRLAIADDLRAVGRLRGGGD